MKKINWNNREMGFTLVELLVALLISGILMATVISVFLMAQKIYTRGGDISYKQKSITNIETDLQNNLSTSVEVKLLNSITSTDVIAKNADYIIGIDDKGQCVEKIYNASINDFDTYPVDQIRDIVLNVTQTTTNEKKAMNYELIPQNLMSNLSGGIIFNNSKNLQLDSRFIVNGNKINLEINKPLFLVLKKAEKGN